MNPNTGQIAGITFIEIPDGKFTMGSEASFWGESPPHSVTIGQPFLISKYPVTQSQWCAFKDDNPSCFGGSPDLPVDSVSWRQAIDFCNVLSHSTGYRVRLPTEAEWEYACRGGTKGDFFFSSFHGFSDESSIPHSLIMEACEYAWCDLNSMDRTHKVGKKLPNPFGLYDVIGNIWEWCEDDWHEDFIGATSDGTSWSDLSNTGNTKVLRGGAWDMGAFRLRSSYRSYDNIELATNRFGLRIVVDI